MAGKGPNQLTKDGKPGRCGGLQYPGAGGPRINAGRPYGSTKLTPEIQAKVIEAVSVGAHRPIAAAYAGIHPSTLHEWMSRGKAGEAPFVDFSEAVERAEADMVVRDLKSIEDASPDSPWQARAKRLEMVRPFEYGRNVQVVQDAGKAPEYIEGLNLLTPEQLRAAAQVEDEEETAAPEPAAPILRRVK